MQSLRSPKWVFLASTAPLLVYLLIFAGEFSVIHTLLPAASVGEWQAFGTVLGLLGLGGAGYAGWRLVRRQLVGGWYSVVALLAFSLWLCLLTTHGNELLPRNVPAWMVPTNPILMAWTFLMPTLAHAMLALVARFTADDQLHQAAPNILFAVVVPMGWGLVFEVLKGGQGGILFGRAPPQHVAKQDNERAFRNLLGNGVDGAGYVGTPAGFGRGRAFQQLLQGQ